MVPSIQDIYIDPTDINDAGSMMVNRLCCWPNNESTLDERLVLAGFAPLISFQILYVFSRISIITLALKGRICHFAKWQIPPSNTKMMIYIRAYKYDVNMSAHPTGRGSWNALAKLRSAQQTIQCITGT